MTPEPTILALALFAGAVFGFILGTTWRRDD